MRFKSGYRPASCSNRRWNTCAAATATTSAQSRHQGRDNPLPIVLVGTGLAWLILSSTQSSRRGYYDDDLLEEYPDDDYDTGDSAKYQGLASSATLAAARTTQRRQKLRGAGQGLRRGGAATRAAGPGPRDRALRGRDGTVLGCRAAGKRRSMDFRGTLGGGAGARAGVAPGRRRPGGAGRDRRVPAPRRARRRPVRPPRPERLRPHARGAAAGGRGHRTGGGRRDRRALPKTETEDEWLGDTRDQLKERARRMTREQLERARAAARAAYEAAIEEADRQGWSAEGAMSAADAAAEGGARGGGRDRRRTAEAERHGGEEAGSSAPSQVAEPAGRSTGGPRRRRSGTVSARPAAGSPRAPEAPR